MPYVKKDTRNKLDEVVKLMGDRQVKADGDLNYILFKYCKYFIQPSYNNYKNFIGELNECAAEIRRRILSEYENDKIKENGDV